MRPPAAYRCGSLDALGLALLLTGVLLGAEAHAATAEEQPSPALLLAHMGEPARGRDARNAVAFRAFEPARRIIAYAILPPFHGDDVRANRGLGIEYTAESGRRYVLAQWPARGGRIDAFMPFAGASDACADAHTFVRGAKPNGIVWSTPRGLVMSLQTDGANDASTLESEWKKLLRRGACR